jgi:hypothetical protein
VLLLGILVLPQSNASAAPASAAQSNASAAQLNGGGLDSRNAAALQQFLASDARVQAAAKLDSSLSASQRAAIKAIVDKNTATLQSFAPAAPSSFSQGASSLQTPSATQVQGLASVNAQMANAIAGVLTSQQQALFRSVIAPPAKGLQPSTSSELQPAQSQTSASTSASTSAATEGITTSASSTTIDAATSGSYCYDAAYYESWGNYYGYYGYLYAYYSYYYGSKSTYAYYAYLYSYYAVYYYGHPALADMGGAYFDFLEHGSDFAGLGSGGQTDLYDAQYYAYYAYIYAYYDYIYTNDSYAYTAYIDLYYAYIYFYDGYSYGASC